MLLNEFGKGRSVKPNEHKVLYHLTDYHGYAYTIDQNTLRSKEGISTTYDPTMNNVGGQMHYHFKFVLNGPALIEKYGAHHYDDYYTEIGYNSRRRISHDEREIRLNTKEITPFSDYLHGIILLFPIFSETSIQWLLYDNYEKKGSFFGGMAKSAAPRAIECLHKQLFDWKKPVWIKKFGNLPTTEEYNFIHDAYLIHKKGGNFRKGMEELTLKYPVIDHFGNILDPIAAKRSFLAPKLVKMLNGYYEGRRYKNINVNKVKELLEKIFTITGVTNNAVAVLIHEIERTGLLHPATPPVTWGSIIREVMAGDIDSAIELIHFFVKRDASQRKWFDDGDDMHTNSIHAGTSFGRMGNYK